MLDLYSTGCEFDCQLCTAGLVVYVYQVGWTLVMMSLLHAWQWLEVIYSRRWMGKPSLCVRSHPGQLSVPSFKYWPLSLGRMASE